MAQQEVLLKVENVKKHFNVGGGTLKAVDGLSFDLYKGETLGLVGESGCGKSTAGRAVLRLYEPTEGKVTFDGVDVYSLPKKKLKELRKQMQIVFQDPYASLNPRMTVEDIIGEALDIHKLAKGPARHKRIVELLNLVGLSEEHASRFPHEFSGGQRQRVGIARALAVEPKFIVCDEPISALDVSIQAQVVNLLKQLQNEMGLTYLFIAHDLSMVKYISDRILVMYLGQMMELAESEELNDNPLHPYTQFLLSAVPIPDPGVEKNRDRIRVEGEIPSPIDPPNLCPFCTRCPKVHDKCKQSRPEWKEVKPNHYIACHLFD
ncbi:ABC transporter ATP-binding protein [Cellulosilyticum ruminicola]|uniref:ABC transporter ATP-binding protein n=1 Tax=Cellulosilyticum ruminicola TaxID=425254 RepID=UPI0006D0CFD7|nr:oligopeptide/dipeptide ABC transporter ATP-binding protein [Cellulosilyticum ruminicola]